MTISLSEPVARTPLHRRIIDCTGYDREDGLWDIEGRLTDTKAYSFHNDWRGEMEPGNPIHDMHVRLTLDDAMTVTAIEVRMAGTPFEICPKIEPDFQQLVGVRIVSGWNMRLMTLFGGKKGCTHVVELLGRMGTVAYQAIPAGMRLRQNLLPERHALDAPEGEKKRPFYVGGCHAWAADGPMVQKLLPEYYEGPDNRDKPDNQGESDT